jgi:hypothetical protein
MSPDLDRRRLALLAEIALEKAVNLKAGGPDFTQGLCDLLTKFLRAAVLHATDPAFRTWLQAMLDADDHGVVLDRPRQPAPTGRRCRRAQRRRAGQHYRASGRRGRHADTH